MQMDAANKINFRTRKTMMVAQQLYEGINIGSGVQGLITYMRTDSTNLSKDAVESVRSFIGDEYGERYLPEAPNRYSSKESAQEAHEAIRPSSVERKSTDLVGMERDAERLYDLIWKRTIASQMEAARMERTTVEIGSADGQVGLRATGARDDTRPIACISIKDPRSAGEIGCGTPPQPQSTAVRPDRSTAAMATP